MVLMCVYRGYSDDSNEGRRALSMGGCDVGGSFGTKEMASRAGAGACCCYIVLGASSCDSVRQAHRPPLLLAPGV
jgi:thiamine monophosphate synthase